MNERCIIAAGVNNNSSREKRPLGTLVISIHPIQLSQLSSRTAAALPLPLLALMCALRKSPARFCLLAAAAAQFWWRGNQGKAGAAQQPGQKLGSSNAQAAELLSLLRRAQLSSAQLADPSRPGECAAKSYITRPAPVVASGGGGDESYDPASRRGSGRTRTPTSIWCA